MSRRLPVYLVLDTSGSMAGEPIESVRQGVRALLADLRSDPHALETAHLAVITFDSTARQLAPLTELMMFQEPNLDASGGTAMGHALTLLDQAFDNEVRKTTATQRGDWRPLVFLMTDGQPGDSWEAAADRVKAKKANIIACAAGAGADGNLLKRITETVVVLNNLQPETMRQFFKWVSSSIKMTSSSVNTTQSNNISLPPPPPNIQIIP